MTATLNELMIVLTIVAFGIAIGFAVLCHNMQHENDPVKPKKVKKNIKVKIRYTRIKCNRMFNDIYRYFGHNTNYSD
jgi:Tfp pilus assembly protein FimT